MCVSLFLRCIENDRVEIFCENVWRNSIAIGKENQLECVFISDGIMLGDFLNGGWPCKYRVENVSFKKMFKVFSCRCSFLFC